MIHSEEKRDTKCLKEVRDSLILRQSEADGEVKKKTLVHSKYASNSFSRLMCAFRFSVKWKIFSNCLENVAHFPNRIWVLLKNFSNRIPAASFYGHEILYPVHNYNPEYPSSFFLGDPWYGLPNPDNPGIPELGNANPGSRKTHWLVCKQNQIEDEQKFLMFCNGCNVLRQEYFKIVFHN